MRFYLKWQICPICGKIIDPIEKEDLYRCPECGGQWLQYEVVDTTTEVIKKGSGYDAAVYGG